jgi:hypothetical protein
MKLAPDLDVRVMRALALTLAAQDMRELDWSGSARTRR